MKHLAFVSLRAMLVFTVLTGVVYPFLMTVVAQLLFPHQANGSLIVRETTVVGSELVGQDFESDQYFWPRPSAIDYEPMPSGSSNAGPTSSALRDSVRERRSRFFVRNHLQPDTPVPTDMLFSSASGVDPHISPEGALLQVNRIAGARGFDSTKTVALADLIGRMTEPRQFGVLGEPRVNVLHLNLALDRMR